MSTAWPFSSSAMGVRGIAAARPLSSLIMCSPWSRLGYQTARTGDEERGGDVASAGRLVQSSSAGALRQLVAGLLGRRLLRSGSPASWRRASWAPASSSATPASWRAGFFAALAAARPAPRRLADRRAVCSGICRLGVAPRSATGGVTRPVGAAAMSAVCRHAPAQAPRSPSSLSSGPAGRRADARLAASRSGWAISPLSISEKALVAQLALGLADVVLQHHGAGLRGGDLAGSSRRLRPARWPSA